MVGRETEFHARPDEMLQIFFDLQQAHPEWRLIVGTDRGGGIPDLQYPIERLEGVEQLLGFTEFRWMPRSVDVAPGSRFGRDTGLYPFIRWRDLKGASYKHPRAILKVYGQSIHTSPTRCMLDLYSVQRRFFKKYMKHKLYRVKNYFRGQDPTEVLKAKGWCTDGVLEDYRAAGGAMEKQCLVGSHFTWQDDCVTPCVPSEFEAQAAELYQRKR